MKPLLTLLLPLLTNSFLFAGNFSPVHAPNKWSDDYSSVAKLDSLKKWGVYNVHDPSCRLIGDKYYMYSTDAIYHPTREEARRKDIPVGFIQMRSSKNLTDWEFDGWVFDSIPKEAVDWVRSNNNGKGAVNVWAPYIVDCGNGNYRLYYCVSAFGKKTSFIGLAESNRPEGPWQHKGAVVKTDQNSKMNAIDPSVITDDNGRVWMHYGSYFGGLYCVELNPATGLPVREGDQGHLVARRANWRKDNLEAPEIFRNGHSGMYYLFYSYDPLMTTYNVRVARADNAEGPFYDFFGVEVSDTTNNYPVLTAPYKFEGHPGWVGTAHCSVFSDKEGNTFMAHQGRYAPESGMMDLHIRQVFFTPSGWPVVSPERYAGVNPISFKADDLKGEWEIIRVREPRAERNLEAGQILWGEGNLLDGEWNLSEKIEIDPESEDCVFNEEKQILSLRIGDEIIKELIVHSGHDWERETDTVLFTGLDNAGRSVWGKRIK
ncbi:MAG: family 43 glycosylhydrolase [Muribaculaceae bacterium]|nr:family 43 glycosylhydrolase [Muribaculaceae bacterium]